ncbi:MAG: hypothetical protein HZA81_03490 [Candidatus Taylorbacteria bacterium]|nr:hypothetical protein [Candidatus Taylorbacteria bacterium]
MRKALIGATILVLAISAIAAYLVLSRDDFSLSKTREIAYDASGFSPRRLVVSLGDRVTFRNESDNPFWPASDLHPSHGIYSQFDPKMPVEAGGSWSFSFEKPGIWKFHDHLASRQTGEIVVLSSTGKVVVPDCKSASSTPGECFQADVVAALKKGGLDAALDRMAELYDTDPRFRDSCHSVAHILGKSAYLAFDEGKEIKLSAKTSYCSYGFYHGFMEEMLQISGDVDGAREFCAQAGKLLASESANAEGACYHGIGHGAADGGDPRAWGDPVALASPGIALCNKVDPTEPHFYRCVSGVFNSIALMFIERSYNLSLDDRGPFEVCKNWKEFRVKNPCYQEMNTLVATLSNSDLSRAIEYVEEIEDDLQYSALAMRSLSGVFPSNFKEPYEDEFESTVRSCKAAREDLVVPCVQGIPSGLMEFGPPGREYEAAIAFCETPGMSKGEQDSCYEAAFGSVRAYYSKEKQKAICSGVDPLRREDCYKP